MTQYSFVRTQKLDVAYLEWNPTGQRTAVLMHGWPDCPETWRNVAPKLAAQGYRVLAPALRGFGRTRFRDANTPRTGQLSALGRDLIEFMDALDVKRPALVGHDWGARAVAIACGLRPGVGSHLVMLSVGYGTNDPDQPLSYAQARNYWYHWFMATPRGERAVEYDRRAFTRIMWDTWAPAGWYTDAEFAEAAASFDNPDWAAIVLHSYRHRWGFAKPDPAYAEDEAALNPTPRLATPTLVLHGGADTCNHPDSSDRKEHFFTGIYRRVVLDGVGHFPQRESPDEVARQVIAFCSEDGKEVP
jgi:pimeloyl-ACP methyl ester carboxylesterase